MPFDKNPETINRNGRPPKEKCLTNLLTQKLDKDKFCEKVIELAMEGDLTAIRYVLNYVDGMPKQTMELSGDQAFIETVRDNFKKRNG
jgi:hypothetical protein